MHKQECNPVVLVVLRYKLFIQKRLANAVFSVCLLVAMSCNGSSNLAS